MERYESGVERYDEAVDEALEEVQNPDQFLQQLERIEFPISKADLLEQLDLNGVPEEMLAKLRGSDTQIFQSVDHVLANTQDAF